MDERPCAYFSPLYNCNHTEHIEGAQMRDPIIITAEATELLKNIGQAPMYPDEPLKDIARRIEYQFPFTASRLVTLANEHFEARWRSSTGGFL